VAHTCCEWNPVYQCQIRDCALYDLCESCEGCSRLTNYNISGLLSSTDYDIYNNSVLFKTDTTDSTGKLPQFSIDLSGEHEIKVEESEVNISSGNVDCSKNVTKKNQKKNIKPTKVKLFNNGHIFLDNYELVSNRKEFLPNATDCKIIYGRTSRWIS